MAVEPTHDGTCRNLWNLLKERKRIREDGSDYSTAAGKVVVVAMIAWLLLLVWWPISHFLLRTEAASIDAVRCQMVSVFDGDIEEDNDWLDSFNRAAGAGLDPDRNAVVDIVDLHLDRLTILKNAEGGMESLREFFELLGVEQDRIDRWCKRISDIEPPTQRLRNTSHRFSTSYEKLWLEENQRSRRSEIDPAAEYYDDFSSSAETPISSDELSVYELLAKWSSASADDPAKFRESIPDKKLIEAFLATQPNIIEYTPWRDKDCPLAKRWLAEKRDYIEALRQLTKKDVYSPWIRLKEQPALEDKDSLLPFNPTLLLMPLEPALEISMMNHVGNKDFEAALSDFKSLARLHSQSWLPSFTDPNYRDRFEYHANKVMRLAIVLACHPEFPSEMSQSLISVFHLLPKSDHYTPPAILNLRSNLYADSIYRSSLTTVNWYRILGRFLDGDPFFQFCVKHPEVIDWRPLVNMIEENRQKAIQTYVDRQGVNETDWSYLRQTEYPITKTYFQEMLLTDPEGKGQALTSLFKLKSNWECRDWLDTRHQLLNKLHETAFYIEMYRNLNGKYPERLSDLSPDLIESPPQDVYSNDALIYQTSGESYELYSVGPNEVDDGGVSASDEVFVRPINDLAEAIKHELSQ